MENRNLSSLDLSDRKRKNKRDNKDSFVHLLFFYIIPFIVLNSIIFVLVTVQPDFNIILTEDPGCLSVDVEIVRINRLRIPFPVKEFHASIEGEQLELTETDKNHYHTTVTTNGTLEVVMINFNKMQKTAYETINSIDDAPPLISEGSIDSGKVIMYVEDTQSGVEYNSIYGIDADGKRITPQKYDEGSGEVIFNFSSSSLEVHVTDRAGKESIANFTSRVLGVDET